MGLFEFAILMQNCSLLVSLRKRIGVGLGLGRFMDENGNFFSPKIVLGLVNGL